jgi:hypothetical protein
MTEEAAVEAPAVAPVWSSGVAEEHKSAISAFTDTAGLAKGYSELFTKMGSSTKIPTAESPAEEVNAFYKQVGRPDTADGYTKPTLAEGQEVDQEFFGNMATIAHESGLSSDQFSKMVGKYVDLEAQRKEAEIVEFNRYREEADRKLHEELGADYDKEIELSKRAYTEYAGDDLKELLATDKYVSLMNEPAFIKMMIGIGKKNMDDTFVKGEGQVEKPVDNYVPNSPNSPTMYANMDGEEGTKARIFFRAKGHVYDRAD